MRKIRHRYVTLMRWPISNIPICINVAYDMTDLHFLRITKRSTTALTTHFTMFSEGMSNCLTVTYQNIAGHNGMEKVSLCTLVI